MTAGRASFDPEAATARPGGGASGSGRLVRGAAVLVAVLAAGAVLLVLLSGVAVADHIGTETEPLHLQTETGQTGVVDSIAPGHNLAVHGNGAATALGVDTVAGVGTERWHRQSDRGKREISTRRENAGDDESGISLGQHPPLESAQSQSGMVDIADEIQAGDGLFNVTITDLNNGGEQGWLLVENLNNSGPTEERQVSEGQVVSVASDGIGGLQPGDSIKATLSANSDYTNILDMDTTTVTQQAQADIEIQSVTAPDEVPVDGNLTVDYTLLNTGDADGTEQFVDLIINETDQQFDDTDENVPVPAGGTTSGTLTFDGVSDFFDPGDTITFTVSLFDTGDQQTGQTEVVDDGAQANLTLQSVDAPTEILVNESLQVGYTIENTGDADGTEQFVDLVVDGTNQSFDDTDEDVPVPAGGTTSGTLTFDGVSDFFNPGDTITFAVSLFDTGDNQTGQTDVTAADDGEADLALQSVDAPAEILVNESLQVGYTIENTGDADGTEQFVDLIVDGTNQSFDDTDEAVTVPAGGTTSGTLTFDGVSDFFDPGDTITFAVSLFDTGDNQTGQTDVTAADDGEANLTLQSVDAPAEILVNESLQVGYTIENTGDADGTEQSVDLFIEGTGESPVATDEDVAVPAGGTTGGTLTFEDVSNSFDPGDTITFTVLLFDTGDSQTGQTDVTAADDGEANLTLQSVDAPAEILVNESLQVEYTIANVGDADGAEPFVDLLVDGTNQEFDDTDENVIVPAGGTTSGTLTFGNVSDFFDPGDTITFTVSLFGTGDNQTGQTDVAEADDGEANLVLQSVDAPAEVLTNESLDVGYTVANVGDANGTESAVDLLVDGTGSAIDDMDQNVTVPAGETTSGTLSLNSVSGFFDAGDTITFTVSLSDAVDNQTGQTDVVEADSENPSIVIDSIVHPASVTVDESLQVGYTLANTGNADGTESGVSLFVDGTAVDTDVDVSVPAGDTTSRSLTFQNQNDQFGVGDSITFTVELSTFDDTENGTVAVEPAAPAFTAEFVSATTPVVAGETLSMDVAITNTGADGQQQVDVVVGSVGTDSAAVSLDSGESTTETFTVQTGADDIGEHMATATTADDQTNTSVTVLEQSDTPEFLVDIAGTGSPVVAGETLSVEAEITNAGGAGQQQVDLVVEGLGTDSASVTLDSNESTTEVFTVETAPGDEGEYTAVVTSETDEDSAQVVVVPVGEFEVSIVETNSPVEAGASLVVDATVTNTGNAAATQTVSLDVGALGTNETTVSLDSGDSTTETFAVETGAGDEGEYTATVASEDSQDTSTVLVGGGNGGEPVAFDVSITETNAPVEEGETLEIGVTITNTGETTDTQTVTTAVGGIGTVGTTVSLDGGESTTRSFTLETASGDAGEYTTSVTSETDQDNASLAVAPPTAQENATFEVVIESVSAPPDGDGEFQANVTVENADDFEDTQTVTLSSNGTQQASQSVTLAGGDTETVSFSWEQTVAADNETTVDIEAASESDSDLSEATVGPADDGGGGGVSTTTGLLLLLVVLALLAAYYYIRRRQLRERVVDTGGSGGATDDESGSGEGDPGAGNDGSGGGGDGDAGGRRSGSGGRQRGGPEQE